MQIRLAQVIADQIRDQIIDASMEEGAKLPTENELVSRFSVSRSTIREAMKTLEAENIIEIRHGLGSYVAENTGLSKDPLGLSFTDQSRLLPELMEVRLLLEPGITEIAAQRRTESDINKLDQIIDRMVEVHRQGKDYHNVDYQFHITVVQCAHNSVLKRIFPVIFEAVERGYAQTVHIEGSFTRAIDYHYKILQAICDRNGSLARELSAMHIKQTLQDIEVKLKGENP